VAASTKGFLFWSPRIIAILFAIFLSLFALDVFSESRGFWETLGALVVHLVPTLLVLAVVAIAWRWELVGAVLFLALAVGYVVIAWGNFPFLTYVIISGPLLIVSVLFFAHWQYRAHVHFP
jgi:hypothetical protein